MANTTNYNWATPDNTDLVKDGAAAIRTLGNSIDTTTKALNPETTLGDIAYRSSTSNTNTRLPIGSNGQILGVSAGVPAWINNDQGDITEVQAGTGISVASGTGPIPVVTNTVATAYDAKGDLIVGTGADTFSKLSVGTNGYTLVADSAEATGLKWAAPASGSTFVGANAYRTTTESLTADTVVIVGYPSENIDTDGFHSTSTNTSRMTVPAGKGGKYLCIVNMFATGGSSRMIMYPYKNGSNVGGSPNWSYVIDNRGYGNAGAFTGVWMMNLVATDYVEVGLYSATNTATLQESTFQFIYLGA